MLLIILSIASSTGIFIVLRLLSSKSISFLPVIIVNYFCCLAIGFATNASHFISDIQRFADSWPFILLCSCLFTFGFWITAKTVQYYGINTATVLAKNAFVLTTLFGFLFLNNPLTWQSIAAIICASIAVFCISPPGRAKLVPPGLLYALLPTLLFLDNAGVEIIISSAQTLWLEASEYGTFVSCLFGLAGVIGLIWMPFKGESYKQFTDKVIVRSGIALGCINYGSMYFLISALNEPGLNSAYVFPINNAGIVAACFLVAFLVFKERPKWFQWVGLCLAILASVLTAL